MTKYHSLKLCVIGTCLVEGIREMYSLLPCNVKLVSFLFYLFVCFACFVPPALTFESCQNFSTAYCGVVRSWPLFCLLLSPQFCRDAVDSSDVTLESIVVFAIQV